MYASESGHGQFDPIGLLICISSGMFSLILLGILHWTTSQ